MFLLTAFTTIFLAPVCFGCSNYLDLGCHYPSGHQPSNRTNCSLLNLSREDAVTWAAETSGALDVTFPLHDVDCGIICYKLELFVYEAHSEEECICTLKPPEHMVPHSKREYMITETCPEGRNCHRTCGKSGLVAFQYVFTGCYQLIVQATTKGSTHMKSYSCGKYVNTNYSKKLIAGTIPKVTLQYSAASRITQVSIAPLIYNHPHTMDVKLRENIDVTQEEACYKTGHDQSRCFIVNNSICDCTPENSTHSLPQCSIMDNRISLVFSDVIPGFYCLNMEVREDRCVEGTIWTKPTNNTKFVCDWHYNFTLERKTSYLDAASKDPQNSNFYIILGVVSAIVVAVIVICLVYMRNYIRNHRPRTTLPLLPSNLIPVEPSRIFLLYARDCQPFMALMVTLREVLEDTTKCEVIDCLDESRWNEIGRSPVEWVRSHIEQPNTKVVLIATQCAYLRQQALLKQETTHYKEPGNYDNLFIYGLKTLTENLSPDVYRKVSVVRFEGLSDDGHLFSHLTPYTRFVLPLHLYKLISNLQPFASGEQNEQLIESKEVQKLSQDLTQLINYKNKNTSYLQDILTIQRNEVS